PIWSGPGIPRIPPGEYQVTLTYELTSSMSGPLVKFEVTSIPFSVVPTTYLNSSTGHHYTYSFVRAASAQVLASAQLSAGPASIQTASLLVNVSSLQSLTTLGSTVGGTFSLQVYFLSIVAVGPVVDFEGG
ncbi:MAG TPA: hypothetical protein VGU43_06970, partial [Thermoplasmata archaeon]|nr:hypothetical protein [Thermoplasmata archaeon]